MNANLKLMLNKFDGCDGGDPGTPSDPSIWVFGLEPGWSLADARIAAGKASAPVDYSIQTQLQWPFNRNAFKLLAAIEGRPVTEYRQFAHERSPFVAGSKGYFKGNLYPFACNNLSVWPNDARAETGMATKAEYQAWCEEHRWPAIKTWVEEHAPRLFIGVGNSFRNQFAKAVFGEPLEMQNIDWAVNGHTKRMLFAQRDGRKLVVVPHLSGGRNGLNSNQALRRAGELIRDFMRN